VSNKVIPACLGVAAALLCPACLFDAPLDAQATVRIDTMILGTWRCLQLDEGPEAKPATFVVNRVDDFRYSIVFQEDAEDSEQYEAFASVVKGRTILNVKVDARANVKPWTLVTYAFLRRPDILHVQVVDDEKLSGAGGSSRTLRQATEKLIHDGLFGDWCVCVRAKVTAK
jgi:hypothetical protein